MARSPLLHATMMPSNRSKRNPDPSRAPRLGVAGSPVGGRDDPNGLRDFVGAGGWRSDADVAGLAGGRLDCNSAGRGRSGSKERKSPDSCSRDKSVAAEPLRPPPCVVMRRGWTTAIIQWQGGRACNGWPAQGRHWRNPATRNDGVPFLRTAFEATLHALLGEMMIGPLICAFGADDTVSLEPGSENYVFR